MKTKQTVKILSRWLISMAFALAASLSFGPAYAAEVVTYFHNDIAGTPMVATDASGNVVWKESYLPYGDKLNNSAASSGNKLGFTGKPYDGDTGLSYMGARYYDPLLGRFMGVDPVGFDPSNIHSFNRYAYGNNNPYKFVDPDGRAGTLVLEAAGAVVIGAIYYALQPPEKQEAISAALRRAIANVVRSDSADVPPAPPADGPKVGGDQGCIYCVKGENTSSGNDYIGSTDNMDQRKNDKTDGRNRDGAQIIDTYPKGDRDERRKREQQSMNDRGGVDKLDNKRNEVRESKWEDKGITPPK